MGGGGGLTCAVCEAAPATCFCFADEAAMCQSCDTTVHQANKLAAKHDRVALSKGAEVSQCDICQDRPAVLFCSEDRALICRRCDIMIHTANEFTAQHHRYLVSGTVLGLHSMGAGGGEASGDGEKVGSAGSARRGSPSTASKASTGFALGGSRDAGGLRLSAGVGPNDNGSGRLSGHMGGGAAPRSFSSGQLVEVPGSGAGPLGDTWISGVGDRGKGAAAPAAEEQMAAAQGQSGSFGALPAFPSGALADLFGPAAPSSSGSSGGGGHTLAHELLGLPSMSQGFSAKDIDAAYLFQDMGGIDDDLSSLLVPDLDFSSIAADPVAPPLPKLPTALQTGNYGGTGRYGAAGSPTSAGSQDGVVPDITAPPPAKRQHV